MSNSSDILIVGAGFSSAMAVLHLLRSGVPASAIVVVGHGLLGAGNAYDCESAAFRLNIREDLPIVFSDDPLHFARWAQEHLDDRQAKTHAGCFYRRNDFAKYVSGLVGEQLAGVPLNRVVDRACNISGAEFSWSVQLESGECWRARRIILASGSATPQWPCPVHLASGLSPEWLSAHMIENPWPGTWEKTLGGEESIILLGGGLTALDAINALYERNHHGNVYLVSPHGMLPPEQAPWARTKRPTWSNNLTPARLVSFVRTYLPAAPTNSSEWQCAWEELRPNLNAIWQGFSAHQRRILLKGVGWLWSMYRFRASPQTISAYRQLEAANQIHMRKGRACEIRARDGKATVVLGNGDQVEGHSVINCTGVGVDSLSQNLIRGRIAIPDALGVSIAVDSLHRVMCAPSQPLQSMFMIGPATMGSLGDVAGASTIAAQAEKLAHSVLDQDTP